MKMMMTNKEMVDAVNRIISMQEREEVKKEKLFGSRIKIVYAIKKNKEKLLQLLKPYNESREELLEECKEKEVQSGGEIKIREDCLGKWNKAMEELLNIEVEVDIHTVKFSEVEGLALSLNDLDAIEFMLEPPEGFDK